MSPVCIDILHRTFPTDHANFTSAACRNTLASSNVLGILADAKLTTDDFNNLATAFYAGYIVFVLPHAWAMQKFPIAKYIATNIAIWSVLTGVQAACKDYSSLCESSYLH